MNVPLIMPKWCLRWSNVPFKLISWRYFKKSASLIGIIQTYISNLWYSNLNNILIWSKQSINWCGDLIWVPKRYIKISNGYNKGRIYIVYKCLHLSHSSIQCYLNTEVFHTYQHVRTHMHVKFEHNLVLTLILQNTMLYKVMVVQNKVFSIRYLEETR